MFQEYFNVFIKQNSSGFCFKFETLKCVRTIVETRKSSVTSFTEQKTLNKKSKSEKFIDTIKDKNVL